jgi:hypothetical protein
VACVTSFSKIQFFFVTSDQFHVPRDQFENFDEQDWSQKPQDPKIFITNNKSLYYYFHLTSRSNVVFIESKIKVINKI